MDWIVPIVSTGLNNFFFAEGHRIEDGRIVYIMQTIKNHIEVVGADIARKFWPRLVAEFLESSVQWQMSNQDNAQANGPEIMNEIEIEEDDIPQRILCKNK